MKFMVIGVTDGNDEELGLRLKELVTDLAGKGHTISTAWLQDERDPTPPGEAQYQRRRYVT